MNSKRFSRALLACSALWLLLQGAPNGFATSYILEGQLGVNFGPDPSGWDTKPFRAEMYFPDGTPDITAPDRLDFTRVTGALSIDNSDLTPYETFAILRQEIPNFDVLDLGYRTVAGDIIISIRMPFATHNLRIPFELDANSVPVQCKFVLIYNCRLRQHSFSDGKCDIQIHGT